MIKEDFANILAAIEEVYNTKFTAEKSKIYFENLDDLEYLICEKAIRKLIQTSEYPPTVASIRKAYTSITNGSKPSLEKTLSDLNKLTKHPFGRYKTIEGMEWLKQNNETAYRIMKCIGYTTYANCNIDYMMPKIQALHKEIVENDSTVLLLQDKFASDINNMKNQGFQLTSQGWEE